MKKPIIIANGVCEITPDFLKKRGIRAVLSDLDNTIAPYRANAPDKAAAAWIKSLKEAVIPLFIVSNAGHKRVAAFCDPLGLPFIARARKPRARSLFEALKRLNVTAEQAVLVGDQYRTDVRAGYNAGIPVILVPPKVKGLFFSIRRAIETPFFRKNTEDL